MLTDLFVKPEDCARTQAGIGGSRREREVFKSYNYESGFSVLDRFRSAVCSVR